MPHRTPEDEQTPEFEAAENRWHKADQDFADAPVASIAGLLLKLRALRKELAEDNVEAYVAGHAETALAFLEGLAGAPSVVDDDHPDAALLALGQEYVRVLALWKDASGTSDDEGRAFHEQASLIECQICDTTPHTPAGLVVLVKLLASFQELDPTFTDGRDGSLSRNILAALERLTPGLAEIGWGPVATPDPAVMAGKEAAEAAAAFNAMTGDEPGPEQDAVQERSSKADAIFADAPVTSAAGALAKMEELRATVMNPTIDPNETYLDARHFKTVVAFLEAVTDGKVAAIGDHPDAGLLARVAEFYRAFEKHNSASEASSTRRAEAEAMPDCPPFATPASDKAASDRWYAFMKAKGVWKLSNKADTATRAVGKAANHVFAIPARTYRGAVEKVKIANLATGDGEGVGNADDDLETYQDFDNPWAKKAIADLERLAGVS